VNEPQEGMSIRSAEDNLVESLILRGAPFGRPSRSARRHAWVDARLLARIARRPESKARGRRQSTVSAALGRDIPWRGAKTRETRMRVIGFELGLSGKGTAMVAKQASIVRRDPRPTGGGFRGSSGGRAAELGVGRAVRMRWNGATTPGAERGHAPRGIACGARRRSRRNGTDAICRGWDPGLASRRDRVSRRAVERCARSNTLKGTETP
jgi:hypothetical protein